MRAPRTLTIFITAVGLVLLAAVWIPNHYPAPIPVLAPDGSRVIGPDGVPVVHRDMDSYYRLVWPGLVCFAASVCLFGWWLVRVLRSLYERVVLPKRTR